MDEEGAICDECGSRIGPNGCCMTRRMNAIEQMNKLDREKRLIHLLQKAQNRLRNQGDVPFITGRMNYLLHDEIERELGGSLFLAESYYPTEKV